MATNYCTSCKAPTDRDDCWYLGVEVFPLYNVLSDRAFHSHKWKKSFYICEECEEMFLEAFLSRCQEDSEVPPEPSHARKSTSCQHCGKHQVKNDARVSIQVGHDYGNGIKAKVSVCFQCFEQEFSRFTIDTKEPLKSVGPLSLTESSEIKSRASAVRHRLTSAVSALK